MAGTTKWAEGWQTAGSNAGLQVAFAFGSPPFASTCDSMFDRTWYAASTSVRQVRTFRGRTHDLDQFGPGTAEIVLDNRSRLYDPSNTDLQWCYFDGYNDRATSDLTTAITGDLDVRVKIRAADWTPGGYHRILACQAADLVSNYNWALVLANLGQYLRFHYSTNGTTVVEKASTAALSGVTDNVTDLWIRVVHDVTNPAGTGNDVKFYYGSDGVSWTQLGNTVTTAGTVTRFNSTATHKIGGVPVYLDASHYGRIYSAEICSGAGIGRTVVLNPNFGQDRWWPGKTVADDNLGNTWTLTNAVIAGSRPIPGTPVKVNYKKPGSAAVTTLWCGFVESLQVEYPGMRDSIVKVNAVDGLKYLALSAISTATTGDLTGTMIKHVIDGAGWPSSALGWPANATTGWRDISPGKSTGLRYKGFRTPALQMCRDLADSEAGSFMVSRLGKAFFRTRDWYKVSYGSTSAVFGDSTLSTELPYTDLSISCDDYQLYNYAIVNRIRGPRQSTWSTDSINRYGKRVLVKNNLLCPRTTEAKKLARWLVARYKEPGVRIERLEVKPRASTKIWDTVDNGVGVSYRVMRRPPGGGLISQICHVEGIEHLIDVQNDDWTMVFNMTPSELFPSSSL